MTRYLTAPDLVAMHHTLIERYGGAHGIRDAGAIEAACYRPQSGYYEDIITQAAALMESLAMNHPFIDGNKRIAFAATDVFLRLNGYRLHIAPLTMYQKMMHLFDTHTFEIDALNQLLQQHVKPITS